MTKKKVKPLPLPDVNIFCSVSHDVWRSLTIVSALSGVGRIKLYSLALEWAVKDIIFRDHVIELVELGKLKVKK